MLKWRWAHLDTKFPTRTSNVNTEHARSDCPTVASRLGHVHLIKYKTSKVPVEYIVLARRELLDNNSLRKQVKYETQT